MSACLATDCTRPGTRRGLCSLHYQRWQRHGSLEDPRRSTDENFWAHVAKEPSGCWIWTGAKSWNGYGQFRTAKDKLHYAHRYSYETLVDPIAEGLQLDHLCRIRACVNPDHLEPVTQAENIARSDLRAGRAAWLETVTHCPQGHPYGEANTRINKGSRSCRECQRIRARERYWRLKGK